MQRRTSDARHGRGLNLDGTSDADQATFRLAGLGPLTGTSGRYLLELRAAGSQIVSLSGASLSSDARIDWAMGPGDANQDGRFDRFDIVSLLAADRFNSGQPATWQEGDFDGNGRFDNHDLVLALMTGSYG